MLTQEEAVEVRVMARQGKSIREIARDLGVSRNTVRRYLRGAQAQYPPRPRRPTKLAPYEDYVRARLAAAQPDVIPATVLLDRDVYGPGQHRWNPQMLGLAEQCAFTPRVCRPYRARTKGKVERFNGYLKGSFVVPLAATLRSGGLALDMHTANREVRRWLDEVANRRTHGTTQARPCDLLVHERQRLQLLPEAVMTRVLPPPPTARVLPFPSIQHPLSVYGELVEAMA